MVIAIQTGAVANYEKPLIAANKCKGTAYALQQWASLLNTALKELWIIQSDKIMSKINSTKNEKELNI